jgi:pantoate--beta-alanine ligase
MIIAATVEDVRKQVKEWKKEGLTIGLVPTMGALHEGHASLVEAAAAGCDRVVASVFVNPTQFGVGEDLDSYPRDFEHDCRILEEKGCSMVFHPEVEEMYPSGFGTYVNVETDMTKQLCGKSRPGHFRGVCTVVSKLFHIAAPDRAYFGQKDAQQVAVIRQMVRDMNFDIEIVSCPIVREADGLAKSSRNSYLSEEERMAALVLSRSVKAAQKAIEEELGGQAAAGGKGIPAREVIDIMTAIVKAEPLARIDYIEAVDGMTMMPKETLFAGDLVAMAVYIGKTRLIDNFSI